MKSDCPGTCCSFSDKHIGLLLRHLWATDGCISVRKPGVKGAPRVYFATSSERLARDVMALLLRLGIVARLRAVAPPPVPAGVHRGCFGG